MHQNKNKSFSSFILGIFVLGTFIAFPHIVQASDGPPKPKTLQEISSMRYSGPLGDDFKTLPLDIRMDAIKEAATSFGARTGLPRRTAVGRLRLPN